MAVLDWCLIKIGEWTWCRNCERAFVWLNYKECPYPGCDGRLEDFESWEEMKSFDFHEDLPNVPKIGVRYDPVYEGG
jgi:hypothetical protein